MDHWWLLLVPGVYPIGLIAWGWWQIGKHARLHRRLRAAGELRSFELYCPECIREHEWDTWPIDRWHKREALRKRLNREEFREDED